MTVDDSYPSAWTPREARSHQAPAPSEAVALAIDSYIAALSPEEFNQLVARTRGTP